jgi:pyruvate formate lyase activating enzyme
MKEHGTRHRPLAVKQGIPDGEVRMEQSRQVGRTLKVAQGHINDVTRFSSVDGPGNRFVISLQGCNFNCISCAQPYLINECSSCGQCVEPCPETALYFDGHHRVVADEQECTSCNMCVDICPSDSTPLSEMLRLDSLTKRISDVAHFISGITVSGGEPTLQNDFVAGLFCALKCDEKLSGLTTFVDSNGHATRQAWERLLPVMDGAMITLRGLDPETHIAITGEDNARVLDTIRYLAEWDRLWEVRLLMIPGMNDEAAAVARTAVWLHDIDPSMRIKLVGFRSAGVRSQYASLRDAEPERMAALAEVVRGVGFDRVAVT